MKLKLFILTLAIVASFSISSAHAENSLQGSGSTFAGNFIDKCRTDYAKAGLGFVGYTGNGSGAGRNFLVNNLVDFSVSDVPFGSNDVQPKKEIVYVPIVAGPIAVAYNLPTYKTRLKLSKEVLAKIFAGQITTWNDPEIQKLNAGKLPNTKITVVFRSDGSGTSEVFTSYLNSVAPQIWTKPGSKTFSSAFPGDINKFTGRFQNANGSTQIGFVQKQFIGSISYNEVTYTKGLGTALIQNEAGIFMAPTSNAAASFLSGLKFNSDGIAPLNYKNPSRNSYNLSTFSYAIAYKNSGEKAEGIKSFFNFALTKCKNIDGYANISGNALKIAQSQVLKISNAK